MICPKHAGTLDQFAFPLCRLALGAHEEPQLRLTLAYDAEQSQHQYNMQGVLRGARISYGCDM